LIVPGAVNLILISPSRIASIRSVLRRVKSYRPVVELTSLWGVKYFR